MEVDISAHVGLLGFPGFVEHKKKNSNMQFPTLLFQKVAQTLNMFACPILCTLIMLRFSSAEGKPAHDWSVTNDAKLFGRVWLFPLIAMCFCSDPLCM